MTYEGPCKEVPGENCIEDCDIYYCPHWIERPEMGESNFMIKTMR